jgi:hypothetical protein
MNARTALVSERIFAMRSVSVILTIVACLSFVSTALAGSKQPWEWTPAERAQARRDPAKRLERLHGMDSERRMMQSASGSHLPKAADVIDGSRNPELFFVTELFEYLVRSAFVTLPGVYPRVVRSRTSDLFRNTADWDRFSAITADYVRVLREEHRAADALDRSAVSAMQSPKCAAEARALRDARRAFGKTRFDRMLYETVPVSMKTSFSMDTDFETSITKALEREERCQ